MGRPKRVDVAGYAYHLLNRTVGRRIIFKKEADFVAFESVLAEAVERSAGGIELLAYCVMGNHWHLVVRTTRKGAISPFMQWLTLTHTQRYKTAHRRVGYGPVYQGRYKSFPIQTDGHLLTVCRYVERNAARAGLVERAEDWQWSSLYRWLNPSASVDLRGPDQPPPLILTPWPTGISSNKAVDALGRPRNWRKLINTPQTQAELDALRLAVRKGRPFGGDPWAAKMIDRHGLTSTLRNPGRPPKSD
jgi:putative transposase